MVGDFGPTCETVTEVSRLSPDMVLLSMGSAGADDMSVCRELRDARPSMKVVILSSAASEEEKVAAMMSGASGFVSTGTSKAEIVRAVRLAANGGSYFDRDVADLVIGRLRELMEGGSGEPGPSVLTKRERMVLSLLAHGLTNAQIGLRMRIAATTVRNYITKIRAKLDLHSRAKLVAYALEHDLLNIPGDESAAPDTAN